MAQTFNLNNFYKSKKWEKLIEQLKLERVNEDGHIMCEHCGREITKKYDCIAHHVIELTDDNVNDYNISLNADNIKLIHFKCHNLIHERFEGFKQNVYLVYGSPCAGKSSWVRGVANDDDLILDIDNIWDCISLGGKYNKSNRLKSNVFGIRDCIIDMMRTRTGNWRNAYIIGGYPLASDRERLYMLLGANPIFIDEDKETCLSRAKNEEWKKYIEDWFDDFSE